MKLTKPEGKTESKRKIKGLQTKRKIYVTAKDLFKKYGYDNVSVDNIVEAAGISKGGFYVHYESKDSLATDLIHDYVNEADFQYKDYIDSLTDKISTFEILSLLADKIADVITNIGCDYMKTIYRVQLTGTLNTDSLFNYNRELYHIFNEIIEKGMQRDEIKSELSSQELAKHCILAIRGVTFEWCIRYPDFDLKQQYLEHFKIFLRGITK